jgi:acetate kinase
MSLVAKWVTIPRRYFAKGIQRYGFHGLSYAYLLEELERVSDSETARGGGLVCHGVRKANLVEFNHPVNHESGLLGISETSPDIRELLK